MKNAVPYLRALDGTRHDHQGAASTEPVRGRHPEAPDLPEPAGLAASALTLGRIQAEEPPLWRVASVGAATPTALATLDVSVDPALIRLCLAKGTPVLLMQATSHQRRGERDLQAASSLVIVGALVTERPVSVDRAGVLEADAEQIRLSARGDVLIRSAGSFLRMKSEDVELYGKQVISRAREICRVLGRLVKIN